MIRRYVMINSLVWLPVGLLAAPMVLLMVERGLGPAMAGLIFTIYGLVVAALELPTGGLADVIGRRGVLAVAAGIGAIGLAGMAFATTPGAFAIVAVLMGTSRALSSGPAEAWFVDSVHAVNGPEADLRPGLSRGEAAAALALAFGTLAGGLLPLFLPRLGPLLPIAAPILLAAVFEVVLLLVVLAAMPEPPHLSIGLRAVVRGVPATVAAGLRLGLRDRVLARLLIASAAIGVALGSVELLLPIRLGELTGGAGTGAFANGLVMAFGFALNASGSALAPALVRWLGRPWRVLVISMVLVAIGLAGLAFSPAIAAVVGFLVVMYLGLGFAGPLKQEITHQRVTSAERATVASITSLSLRGGVAVTSTALGALAAAAGFSAAWLIAAGIVLLSSLLYVRLSPTRAQRPDPAPIPDPPRPLA